MAEYGKLLSRIWSDPDFTALDARAQQLYALLISYPTRNLAGVLPLTVKRWVRATADATIDNITAAAHLLAANRFIVIDWDTEEVLIRTYIRNDEVYRQPNLMISARKLAQQVESAAIKFALHDELMALPAHKNDSLTIQMATALVKGLTKPFREPIDEPIDEPPGVGVVTYVRDYTFHLSPSPAPTPVVGTLREPLAAESATPAADLVRATIPSEHPAAVKTQLRIRASELLNTGTPAADVRSALELWLAKPNLHPNVLASLVSEVIKTRGDPINGRRLQGADLKVAEFQALKSQFPQELPQ